MSILYEALKKRARNDQLHGPEVAELLRTLELQQPKGAFASVEDCYTAVHKIGGKLVKDVASVGRMMLLKDIIQNYFKDNYNKRNKTFHNPRWVNSSQVVPTNSQSTSGLQPSHVTPLAVTHSPCQGCGRNNHERATCALKAHPDYNTQNVPWLNSEKGKQWTAKSGNTCLPATLALDGKQVGFPEQLKRKPRGLNNDFTSCDIITTNGLIHLQALLDTGARHGNYVSTRVASLLVEKGVTPEASRHATLCGAFKNTCSDYVVQDFNFNLQILNEKTLTREIIKIQATSANIDYDLIVGRPTVKELKLVNKFPSHFFEDNVNVNSAGTKESDQLHPNLVSSKTACYCCALNDASTGNQTTAPPLELQCTLEPDIKQPIDDDSSSVSSDTSSLSDDINESLWDSHQHDETLPFDTMVLTNDLELQERLTNVILEYRHIFSRKLRAEPANVPPFDIEVDEEKWYATLNQKAPRLQNIQKQEVIQKNISQMLELGIIRPSSESTYSQVHLPPKPGPDKYRFCLDFINLNKACKKHGWPIPNISQALQRISNAKPKIFGKIDLTKGYYQCPLTEKCKRFTAFITFMGCFEWTHVAMGLIGAGGYFQQTLALVVLSGLLYIICELYIDDILLYAQTNREFITRVRQIFERMSKYKLILNPDKCAFGMSEVEFVGHLLSSAGINFSETKKRKLIEFKKPFTFKEMKSFLGLANYFRDHIHHYADITNSLQDLVSSYTPGKIVQWTPSALLAFEKCKQAIQTCPTLTFLDYHSPIVLETDASDYAIGAYLYQIVDDRPQPVNFLSKTLNLVQLRWDTPTKEAYAIFYAIRKLSYLLRDVPFTLKTDHKNLIFMKSSTDSKVYRWNVELQEFDYQIEHIKGEENVVAEYSVTIVRYIG